MIDKAPDETVLLVGEPKAVAPVLESLRAAGVQAKADEQPEQSDAGEIQALSSELLRLESGLRESQPRAVVLVDAGDRALAAALVATKLLIPVAAVAVDGAEGENTALLAQLADRKLSADASEIQAWLEGLPTLPELR